MIYTLGESLLDIIFESSQNAVAKPGGGMLNASVSLARSGVEVSLISELGDDTTAQIVLEFLAANAIGIEFIKKYYHQKSSVALAFLNESKVASFSIYKSYPENRHLILPENLAKEDVLVFGSLYSLDPQIRTQVLQVLIAAKKAEALICYDPNIRSHDLTDPVVRNALIENIAFADIVKASDQDMATIFGDMSFEEYFAEIQKINPGALFILTLGTEGVIGYCSDYKIKLPVKEVNVVSTIGAGDSFNAGMVYYLEKNRLRKHEIGELEKAVFKNILESGQSFSAEVCTTMENYISKK